MAFASSVWVQRGSMLLNRTSRLETGHLDCMPCSAMACSVILDCCLLTDLSTVDSSGQRLSIASAKENAKQHKLLHQHTGIN